MTYPTIDSQETYTMSPSFMDRVRLFTKFGFSKPTPLVGVIRLSGIITNRDGMFKGGIINLEDMNDQIEQAFSLPEDYLKAVVLQINSPGGAPVQSELVYKRIRELSEEKAVPVISFIEDAGASGGYWLACAGDEIFASAGSIVGSIGVVSSMFGFVEAIRKLGVERRVYTQGENKAILDQFQPEKESDVKILKRIQKDIHEWFKDMVRERRAGKIRVEDEKRLFSGEFWTGREALELGLVDDLGDMYSVIRQRYGDKVKFVKVSKEKGWFRRKLKFLAGAMATSFTDSFANRITEQELWNRLGR